MFFDCEHINIKTSNDIDEPHRHNFYELFVLQGQGNHLIDFKSYGFDGYTLHLICPKQVHLLNRKVETNGFVLKFDAVYLTEIKRLKNFYSQVLYNSKFEPVQEIKKEAFEIASLLFQELKNKKRDAMKHHSLVSFLTSFFKLEQAQENDKQTAFEEFLKELEKSYKEVKSASVYADKLNITLRQLNEVVKMKTGLSAKQFIQERLLLEAKRMLFHGELSVKEIAYELNFKEPAHFSNFFKKELGVSPNEFKKEKAPV